jgi:hypothetical protein
MTNKEKFQNYCKGKIVDFLGAVDVEDLYNEDETTLATVLMTDKNIREYNNVRVIIRNDYEEEDSECLTVIDSNDHIVIHTPMLELLGYTLRMEFDKIDKDYYQSIIDDWDDYYDEYFEAENE